MIKLIAAIDQKRGIAKTGTMPWYIKADLRHFKELTTGHTVLMGHKTYETIGKPLPNRHNVVASHQFGLEIDGAEVTHDAADYLRDARGDIWVIGGEELFEATMPRAQELYLTQIEADFDCDRFFPPYKDDFKLVHFGDWQTENDLKFRFEVWRRTA